jgi:hypothetical protein
MCYADFTAGGDMFRNHTSHRRSGFFALCLAGAIMATYPAQSATFACDMPNTKEAVALCAAVKPALAQALQTELTQGGALADYRLVIERAKPINIIAHLDAFGVAGPRLGLSISDAKGVPMSALATFAAELVGSLK